MKHLIIFQLLLIVRAIQLGFAHENFFSKSNLNDGAHRVLIHVKRIRASQITVGPKEGTNRGIVLRQVSNGRQVVYLIYNGVPPFLRQIEGYHHKSSDPSEPSLVSTDEEGLTLRECNVEKNEEQVREFIDNFDNVSKEAQDAEHFDLSPFAAMNSSYATIHRSGANLPEYLEPLLQFHHLKSICFKLRRQIRLLAHKKKNNKKHSSTRRLRRGVTNLLSVPHTKWCGTGYSAQTYADLGGLYGADICCRQHDMHCPFYIESFERKFGYFNFGIGTLSHCSCDRRFKTCLKQSGTGASDVVGTVFFNIVKSHCFVFKRRRVCTKRNFWRCLKWDNERQAVIREPIRWNY